MPILQPEIDQNPGPNTPNSRPVTPTSAEKAVDSEPTPRTTKKERGKKIKLQAGKSVSQEELILLQNEEDKKQKKEQMSKDKKEEAKKKKQEDKKKQEKRRTQKEKDH